MIRIDDYKNQIIEAYIETYGQEYSSVIEERINNQIILLTIDNHNLYRLIHAQNHFKLLDLNVDFYASIFPKSDFEEYRPRKDNIYSIDDDLPLLLFDDIEEDLEHFDFKPIKKIIKRNIGSEKYKELQQEKLKYEEKMESFKHKLLSEEEIEENDRLIEKHNKILNERIKSILPNTIKDALETDQLVSLFSTKIFDCFSKENIDKLHSGTKAEKYYRKKYIDDYFKIFDPQKIDKSNLKQYIPDPETLEKIHEIHQECIINYQKEQLLNNENVKSNPSLQKLIEENTEKICLPVFYGQVCQLNFKENNEVKKLILFPITDKNQQTQDLALLHEFGHSITTNDEGTIGIEDTNAVDNYEENSINNEKRKYEVFNEILTDIFASIANKKMQQKKEFIIEDEISSFEYDSLMQSNQLADYVLLLFELLEPEIKKSMIEADQSYIKNIITNECFEDLNNVINERYNLSHNFSLSDIEYDKKSFKLSMDKDDINYIIMQNIDLYKTKNREY